MRIILALLSLAQAAFGEDDLFTGVPEKPLPVEARSFLTLVRRAVDSGDSAQVLRLVSTDELTGAGWVIFRKKLGGIEKGKKVKSIEMIEGVVDANVEIRQNGVVYKTTAKPTHTVLIRMEEESGAMNTLELPAAEVDANNSKRWRLIAMVPVLPGDGSVRLVEAEARRDASPTSPYGEAELTYLHALLGRKEQVEKGEASLVALAQGKGQRQAFYIYTRLGWCWLNLDAPKKALDYFLKGHEAGEGKNWASEFGLAVGYYLNGEPEKAVRHFDHAAGVGVALSDREEMEKFLSTCPAKERDAAFGLQALWMRTIAPQ